MLRANKHHSKHLQQSWNKYGESKFEFRVLVRCRTGKCVPLEQKYMDKFKSYDIEFGYNINPTAGSCKGVKRTPEQNETNRRSQLGKHPMSPERKSHLMQFVVGRVVGTEERIQRSISLTGRKASEKTRENMRIAQRKRRASATTAEVEKYRNTASAGWEKRRQDGTNYHSEQTIAKMVAAWKIRKARLLPLPQ